MSYAVPVLVTNTTPWREVHMHGAGWWVPWESFGAALKEAFAESREQLSARGWTGRRYVSRMLGWEVPAARLTDFYRKLVADFAKKRQ
jgi:glycosyltransferase involved in cell wall biosynthesis